MQSNVASHTACCGRSRHPGETVRASERELVPYISLEYPIGPYIAGAH